MAILHRKEEKIQVVLGRLPKKYTDEQFVEMFIKLYSKDWGKIKSAYIKQSQDKEPGTVVNMPKPDLYLKQILAIYLSSATATAEGEPVKERKAEADVKNEKVAKKSKIPVSNNEETETKKSKMAAKNKISVGEEMEATKIIKKKAPAKKENEDGKAASKPVKKAKAGEK